VKIKVEIGREWQTAANMFKGFGRQGFAEGHHAQVSAGW